jgi:hypothetical protein
MTAEAIFDIITTKNQEMLFFVGRQRFQSCLYLLYVVNFVFLSVTILLVTLQLLGLFDNSSSNIFLEHIHKLPGQEKNLSKPW